MKRYHPLAALVVLLLLVGCGSGGGSSTPNPFVGSWSGTWSDPGTAQTGTLNVTIGSDGHLTGQIVNAALLATGSASGTVDNAGDMNATYTYPGQSPVTAGGTVAIGSDGRLTGTVTEKQNGQTIGTSTFGLTRQ